MRAVTVAIVICLLIITIGSMGVSFFFRHPALGEIDWRPGEIKSPAYGTVKRVERLKDTWHIIIFLSPFDIHRQYYPANGHVISREHDKTGNYYLAFDLDKSSENEKIITTMMLDSGEILIFKQIAGWFARCVAAYESINQYVFCGQPAGMIEFGSRVDIIFPSSYTPRVKPGEYVHGPDSLLASLSVC